jgi:TonB family protein
MRTTGLTGIGLLLLGAMACAGEIQVPESQAKHAAVSRPAPTISPLARQMKLAGHVEVAVSIDETGAVTDVKPTQGIPALATGVVEAVKKWKFSPFADPSGAPAKATTTLGFDFKQ